MRRLSPADAPDPMSFAEPRFRLSEHRLDERTAVVAVRGEIEKYKDWCELV